MSDTRSMTMSIVGAAVSARKRDYGRSGLPGSTVAKQNWPAARRALELVVEALGMFRRGARHVRARVRVCRDQDRRAVDVATTRSCSLSIAFHTLMTGPAAQPIASAHPSTPASKCGNLKVAASGSRRHPVTVTVAVTVTASRSRLRGVALEITRPWRASERDGVGKAVFPVEPSLA